MPAEYEPYGAEWERDLMKWRKGEIISLLRQVLTKEEKFTSTNSRSTPCCKTDVVGVVAYYKCSTCGRIVEPERD